YREQLQDRGISQKEFAVRMGFSEKHISRLIHGDVLLTHEVAIKLERVLGIPASFWNNLEALYQDSKIRVAEENEMEEDKKIARQFPYNKMAKLGWVEDTRKPAERVNRLREFFEVTRLSILGDLGLPLVAWRQKDTVGANKHALMAWVQKASLEARSIATAPLNIEKLKSLIPSLRQMTREDPEEFLPQLQTKLAECGVALVVLPHLDGSFLHGAALKEKDHILLGVTVRGKYADVFWFSFFHELGHIILGDTAADEPLTDEEIKAKEAAADRFSADTLIAPEQYEVFCKEGDFSEEAIIAFADTVNIDPGIVLGRLNSEELVPYNQLTHLKKQYLL
ncbi:MAG: helix-turn-helix domain-containing protein, partial [Clostridiaceae bacterium]|nr:helix-turn-helix domain-containing protein [Clostridiaceae bacterium]